MAPLNFTDTNLEGIPTFLRRGHPDCVVKPTNTKGNDMPRIGPKEQQRIDMRIRNAKAANRPSTIPAEAPAQAEPTEDTMTTAKRKTTAKGHRKAKGAPSKKAAAKPRKQPASPRKATAGGAPAKETNADRLKAFLQEPGGKVSADLEKKFDWLPHTARAAVSRLGSIVKKTKDEARGTVYSIET